MSAGRVLHTGQAIVDLVMRIGSVPEPGADTFASSYDLEAGGGFNVMAAAARDGATVVYAGAHGTGPFGDRVRSAMNDEGVHVLAARHENRDTGFSIALVDDTAERTFISTLGAEGDVTTADYAAAHATANDIVYVTGYSLLHDASRSSLLEWLPSLPEGTRLVVDASPVINHISEEVIRPIASMAYVWSTNEREARLVANMLGVEVGPDLSENARTLAATLGCTVLLRAGAQGAILAPWRPEQSGPGKVEHIPAYQVEALDTNGAGDAHCGVLCAQLAQEQDLLYAVRRANVASALAVTRHGPATSPTKEEIDVAM